MSETVLSFQQISAILSVTDAMGLDREWVEIPLSPARPGMVRRLPNGKLEIVVDSDVPFDQWLTTLPDSIRALDTEAGATRA
ncbi:hypothetical protein YTPLAS18_20770 [Nitrospira sp.]|nr:hypothetical protein YTPLAS18_20770 [Nitrospira sp.]